MANVPSYDSSRYSFGPGIIYMGAEGTTPTIDIGSVKGDAELSIERTRLEVHQGSPQVKVAQYATKEEVILKVTGIEWNLSNIAYAIGAGSTGSTGAVDTLEFGGAMTMNNRAIRFLHLQPDGSTIDIHLFKCEGAGALAMALKETETHEFPYEFHVLRGTTDFEGSVLAASKRLFKITRTRA